MIDYPFTKCRRDAVTEDSFYNFSEGEDLRHSTYKEAKCQYKWMMREICDQCRCYLSKS